MADDKQSADSAAKELEDVHNHADPAKGAKSVEGGDRANITPVDQGRGVAEKDKKF